MIMLRGLRIATLCLLVCGFAVAAAVAWRPSLLAKWTRESIDDFGPLGAFSFLGPSGAMNDRDLQGKVCVYACFFTCCTETCPVISGALARLQHELADLPDVRLISLTVDPATDTPAKLVEYGAAFGAKPDRWIFLTGDRPAIESFVTKQLKVGLQENKGADIHAGNKFLHSEKLIIVDRNGRIRGYFLGTQPEEVESLRKAVARLHG